MVEAIAKAQSEKVTFLNVISILPHAVGSARGENFNVYSGRKE